MKMISKFPLLITGNRTSVLVFFFHSMQLKLILRISFTGKRRLKDLLLQKDNRFCADCAAPDPKWA